MVKNSIKLPRNRYFGAFATETEEQRVATEPSRRNFNKEFTADLLTHRQDKPANQLTSHRVECDAKLQITLLKRQPDRLTFVRVHVLFVYLCCKISVIHGPFPIPTSLNLQVFLQRRLQRVTSTLPFALAAV